MKKIKVAPILSLVFLLGLALALRASTAETSGAVYIRGDGSIDPSASPISTTDNATYTLNGDINDGIIVERDNILLNGNGHSILGEAIYDIFTDVGLVCDHRTNVTVTNVSITAGTYVRYSVGISVTGSNLSGGVTIFYSNYTSILANRIAGTANFQVSLSLERSNNNNLSNNNVTYRGIGLIASAGNMVSGNNIVHNILGIYLSTSDSNIVINNNITETIGIAIGLTQSMNNVIYHNNFINNTSQASLTDSGPPHGPGNTWDNGFPSGGNYWSDFKDVYPNATEIDSSGIWNTTYSLMPANQDNYPLVHPIPEFSSFLIIPIFTITTLLAVITYRRKQSCGRPSGHEI